MIKVIAKYLSSLGLFLAVGSVTVTPSASAQTTPGRTGPTGNNEAFTMVNYQTGYCLGVAGNNSNIGTQLITWPCNGTTSQSFWFGDETAPGLLYFWPSGYNGIAVYTTTLVSMLQPCSGCWNVVGVGGGYDYQLAPVETWTEDALNTGNEYDDQGWWPYPVGQNSAGYSCYIFENAGEPQDGSTSQPGPWVMGVENASTAPGGKVVVWQNQSFSGPIAPNQIWCLEPAPFYSGE